MELAVVTPSSNDRRDTRCGGCRKTFSVGFADVFFPPCLSTSPHDMCFPSSATAYYVGTYVAPTPSSHTSPYPPTPFRMHRPMIDSDAPAESPRTPPKLFGVVPLSCLPAAVQNALSRDKMLFETVIGVVIGIVFGLALAPAHMAEWINQLLAFPGTCFLRLLKMFVLPLITGSIMSGVINLRRMGSGDAVKKVTQRALLIYVITYLFAIATGLAAVGIIKPGEGTASSSTSKSDIWQCKETAITNGTEIGDKPTMVFRVTNVVYSALPTNVFEALANSNILGVITFCIFLASALPINTGSQPASGVEAVLSSFNNVVMKLINVVLGFTPIGVLSLILSKITAACDIYDMFTMLGKFVLTVLLALMVHGMITLPIVYRIGTGGSGKGFKEFFKAFSKAFVTAAATSSSAATLPITIQCAQDYGADKDIANFVLVLGSTVNMDGTAMYEAIAALFIAQRHAKDITLDYMIIIAITGSLAAMGAAAIPSAGLVTLLTVLQAADLSEYADDIALILVVDWFLDRVRTGVNVFGDCVAVCIVSELHQKGVRRNELETNTVEGDVEMRPSAAPSRPLTEQGEFMWQPGDPVAFDTFADGTQISLSGGTVMDRALSDGRCIYTIRHSSGVFTGWKGEWMRVDPASIVPPGVVSAPEAATSCAQSVGEVVVDAEGHSEVVG